MRVARKIYLYLTYLTFCVACLLWKAEMPKQVPASGGWPSALTGWIRAGEPVGGVLGNQAGTNKA